MQWNYSSKEVLQNASDLAAPVSIGVGLVGGLVVAVADAPREPQGQPPG
jgi:hypothetical protein